MKRDKFKPVTSALQFTYFSMLYRFGEQKPCLGKNLSFLGFCNSFIEKFKFLNQVYNCIKMLPHEVALLLHLHIHKVH